MLWLIRLGMYLVSGVTVWHFVQGSTFPGLGGSEKLSLDQINGMVLGVCAGFSNYTNIDVSLVRLGFALATLYRGIGLILYLLAFLILPVS